MTASKVKIYLVIPQLWTICCVLRSACPSVCPLVCQFICLSVSRSLLSMKDTDDKYSANTNIIELRHAKRTLRLILTKHLFFYFLNAYIILRFVGKILVLISIFSTVPMLLRDVKNFLKKRAFSSKNNCGITILVPLSKSRIINIEI